MSASLPERTISTVIFRTRNTIWSKRLPNSSPISSGCAAGSALEYFLAAAGSQAGTIQINVHPDLIGSSVHREVDGGGIDGQTRTVDVIRIDDLVQADRKGTRMIKVDVQGAELQVLEGAQQCLRDTDVVILETSLIGTLQDAPELSEVVRYMKDRGFVVFDIIGGEQRPLDRSLAQVDLVFVPQSHPLRADRRWQRIG